MYERVGRLLGSQAPQAIEVAGLGLARRQVQRRRQAVRLRNRLVDQHVERRRADDLQHVVEVGGARPKVAVLKALLRVDRHLLHDLTIAGGVEQGQQLVGIVQPDHDEPGPVRILIHLLGLRDGGDVHLDHLSGNRAVQV